MIRGITCTHIQSVWNHSGPQKSPIPQTNNWSGIYLCCLLQQTGSSAITRGARSFSQTCSVQLCTSRNANPCIACRENLMNRKKGLYDGGQFIAWYVFGPFCQQRFSQLHSIFPCHAMLQGKNNQMRRQLCLEMDCFKRFRVFP